LLSVLTAKFNELDPRSVVMLMQSLARLRFPTKDLYVMIARSIHDNHASLDPKDVTILLWAFSRVQYYGVDKKVGKIIYAKHDS
jgi:hypothetical protein